MHEEILQGIIVLVGTAALVYAGIVGSVVSSLAYPTSHMFFPGSLSRACFTWLLTKLLW